MREGSDRLSGICSMCYRFLALVIAFCFSGSMAAQKATMIDVGVVVPRSVITNETVSASMVSNPRDFSGITTLQVIPAQLPGIPGVNAADLLKKYKVQAGDNAGFVPADQPFSFTATDNVQLKIARSDIENAPVTNLKLPLTFGGAPAAPAGPGYHIPPLTLAGAVHLIHGPLSGDSRKTQITVNGAAAKILAESPSEVFCFVPPATLVGPAEWILEDSGRRAKLKTWVLALQMSADKLKLMKGESTAFHVYIKGVETIPQEAWFGSGDVPELVDPALITRFLPNFKPPSPSQPGVLVLTLENMSAGTVTMSGGNKLALTFSYGQGKYEHHGTITATRAGSFDIDGTLIPFLHDQPDIPPTITVGNDNIENPPIHTPSPTPTPTPVATTEKKKKEEDCPQRGKGCVALVIDFSHNVSWEFDMESLNQKLTAAGCETDYVAPDLWEIPLDHTYGYEGVASYTSKADPKEQDKAREHNTPEWKKVREAIAKHREKVARGVELAIEIVNGHGDGKSGDGVMRCGDWVWKEYTGDFLLRADFHEGNYRAANKNVCGWFTSDFSCYGGLTPKVVDELNNFATSTCSQASALNCPIHAGWEADSSTSTAVSTATCSNGSIGWQKSYIGDPLDAETERRKNSSLGPMAGYGPLIEALRAKAGESSTARYADKGYAKDKPPAHARGGYGEESSK
jgi:hypothetical protein